ncbi:DUF3895 domain-containing protein [Sutcliffiella cohnii]|uniref:DUF3895 domain-containing protein n=1 Tax=Sutcliffiella cohnii TaxID=33932 RepID=UPI00082EFBCE|nr:DUF3895 domain-containing protein [Sutcliffiella cohnii]
MNQISFDDLFKEEQTKKSSSISKLQEAILELLESDITSALEICECLIKSGLISNERFSSNKPKDYPKVCLNLDEMVLQEKLEFVEDIEKTNRIYHLKGN